MTSIAIRPLKPFRAFLSCLLTPTEAARVARLREVRAVYRVCGAHPWFVVLDLPAFSNLHQFAHQNHLGLKHWSLATHHFEFPAHDTTNDGVDSWVFLGADEQFDPRLYASFTNDFPGTAIRSVFHIFGEYQYLVNLHSHDLSAVDTFLTHCRHRGLTSSTKCVLYTLVSETVRGPADLAVLSSLATAAQHDLEYAITRIVANADNFSARSAYDQLHLVQQGLRVLGVPAAQTRIEHYLTMHPDELSADYPALLQYKNNLIDRFSVKLNRSGWLPVLLFLKTTRVARAKDALERAIQQDLLGVSKAKIARKLYHMTGDADFLIPIRVTNMEALSESLRSFLGAHANLVQSSNIIICKDAASQQQPTRDAQELGVLDIPFIEALLISSINMDSFEHRIRTRIPLQSLLSSGGHPVEEELGISPREDHVRFRLRQVMNGGDTSALEEYLCDFDSFAGLGLSTTVEFSDAKVIQVLLRAWFPHPENKDAFVADLRDKQRSAGIIATILEPIRDATSVIVLLVAKSLVEIEQLVRINEPLCSKLEFHVLFHQRYYPKGMDVHSRCHPCIFPTRYEASTAGQRTIWSSDVQPPCSKCSRYPSKRTHDQQFTIDAAMQLRKRVRIALIGFNLHLSEILAIDEHFEPQDSSERAFQNYGRFLQNMPEEVRRAYPSEDAERDRYATLGRDFRRRYEQSVLRAVRRALNTTSPDLIVLPEYCVPRSLFQRIVEEPIRRPCVIVAGSHIWEQRNVSPLIFVRSDAQRDVYFVIKNRLNELEQALAVVTKTGSAQMRFVRTECGNILSMICYDAYSLDRDGVGREIDCILAPSVNTAPRFKRLLVSRADQLKCVVAYANALEGDGIGSEILYPKDGALYRTLHGVGPFHRDAHGSMKINSRRLFSPLTKRWRIGGFEFVYSVLSYDPVQLDLRRSPEFYDRN